MPKDYRIENTCDLLQVPAERRQRCLRELFYALEAMELAGKPPMDGSFTWTDDDDATITLFTQDGGTYLTLHVEQPPSSPPETEVTP